MTKKTKTKKTKTTAAKKAVRKPAKRAAAKTTRAVKKTAKTAAKTTRKNARKTRAAVKKSSKTAQKQVKKAATKQVQTAATSAKAANTFFTELLKESMMTKTGAQNPFQNGNFEKLGQDMGEASKDSYESAMKSCTIFMKGMEDMMKTSMAYAQECAERNTNAFKDMMSAKTLNEAVEKQNWMAQQNFDDMMQSMTKLSEMGVKVCSDCMEPVNDQMNKTIKKATDTMAA